MRNYRIIIPLSVALILLIIGSSMLGRGLSAPRTTYKEETRLSYKVQGAFDDHQAYRKSIIETDSPDPRYFTAITDSILATYNYSFLSEERVSAVTGQAEISAVLQAPGLWQKEFILVPKREFTEGFSTSFQLDTDYFLQLTSDISKEIGVATSSPLLILKATIHVEAETSSGVLKDDFIQTCQVDLSTKTTVWRRPFTLSRKRYWEGLIYNHQGTFGYAIQLKPNILFGATTIHSDILQASPTVKLDPSSSYPADTTGTIDVTLSYQLDNDEPVTRVENEVEVNAVLAKPDGKEFLFNLVPRSLLEGNSATFPLDIALYYDIIAAEEEGTEGTTPNYELTISADVHTVAYSEFGVIDETINPGLKVILGPNQLAWPKETEETKTGSFTETIITPNTGRNTTITGSLGVLGMALAVLLYTYWSYSQTKGIQIPAAEAEAIRAKKEHKDIIVDVQALPPMKGQVVIPLDSLDELIKIADALLKPVLHQAEVDKHAYYVTDGITRYQYISAGDPEPEGENNETPG